MDFPYVRWTKLESLINFWFWGVVLGFFCHFKLCKRHAILHDAAGLLRSHGGKGPGYCYTIGREPNSCVLGHVTGLLFCRYLKFLLPSIFNSVVISSSISFIVLDIELSGINVNEKLGAFIEGNVLGYSFCPQSSTDPWNNHFDDEEIFTELCEKVGIRITVTLST